MKKFLYGGLPVLLFLWTASLWAQQSSTVEDAPGPLSTSHKETPGLKSCRSCHNNDLEVVPGKCLACHQEIASRISSARGFHRDKSEDCGGCHTEHGGAERNLVDLDVKGFDHEETGYPLLGKHKTVAECLTCHKKENSFPGKTVLSYLMSDSRCVSCHKPQHPGRQDNCQVCHGLNSWRVEIWGRKTV